MSKVKNSKLFKGVLTKTELAEELKKFRNRYGRKNISSDPEKDTYHCKACGIETTKRCIAFPAGGGKFLKHEIPHCLNCDEEPHYPGASIDLPKNSYSK